MKWNIYLMVFVCFALVNNGCKKPDSDPGKNTTTISVKGLVQKGPFAKGTDIILSELNMSLDQTGRTFNSQIETDYGAFNFNEIELASTYVQFKASGFYFNEVKGTLSNSALTLLAISDLDNKTNVNVNILTHLEKNRVEYLIKKGYDFNNAKKNAQKEILAVFGFSMDEIETSELLDITKNSAADAILLAISVILQGDRTVGEFSELLANLSLDLKEDGILSDPESFKKLRRSAIDLNPFIIRKNIQDRYNAIGINVTIPDFEKYLNQFLAYSASEPTVTTLEPTNIMGNSAVILASINPNSSPTTALFEYGLTTDYGDSVILNAVPFIGDSSISLSDTLTGLLPLTTYHYRIKAYNILGTSVGEDRMFTTTEALPTVQTSPVTNIGFNEASTGGTIPDDGKSPVTARGVCFSTSPNPTITDVIEDYYTGEVYSPTINGSGAGEFSTKIKLLANTTYYLRAYATNEVGTAYGQEISFKTPSYFKPGGGLVDQEGNSYKTVIIDGKEWMAENFRSGLFQNKDSIVNNTDCINWFSLDTPAWIYYENKRSNNEVFGKLYNRYVLEDNRKICPSGWHVSTLEEWNALIAYLGPNASSKLADTKTWGIYLATNESGLSLPPSGRTDDNYCFNETYYGYQGNFFAYPGLVYLFGEDYMTPIQVTNDASYRFGYSIRCVKD